VKRRTGEGEGREGRGKGRGERGVYNPDGARAVYVSAPAPLQLGIPCNPSLYFKNKIINGNIFVIRNKVDTD